MNILDSLKKYASTTAFSEYHEDIERSNLNAMYRICIVGMLGGAVLTFLSLSFVGILSMPLAYISFTALFTAVFILCKTVLPKRPSRILPVYYTLIIIMLALGIVMGTYCGTDTNATTFIMFVVSLPMLIVDKPYRINIVFGIASVLFIIIDCTVKTGALLRLDISNCAVFFFLSIALSWQTIGIKISDMAIKRELKQRSDMDTLTSLSNRGAFERIVTKYISESDESAIMLIMDVDNFK